MSNAASAQTVKPLESLPPLEASEIRIVLSGGIVQGYRCGAGVDISTISLMLLDYDIEGFPREEMGDTFFVDSDGYELEYRHI